MNTLCLHGAEGRSGGGGAAKEEEVQEMEEGCCGLGAANN